jgi:hypothetical protein
LETNLIRISRFGTSKASSNNNSNKLSNKQNIWIVQDVIQQTQSFVTTIITTSLNLVISVELVKDTGLKVELYAMFLLVVAERIRGSRNQPHQLLLPPPP